MAYIGQGIKEGTFSVLDTSGNTYNGSNVTFSLGTQVGSPAQLLVSHDGVIQKPGTDYSLASGGTQITFSTAPASGASIFIVEISGAVGGPLDSDLNGTELILDADGDTSITADTDDQIDIKVAGADDFQIVANNFKVLSGSTLTVESGATITNSGTANGFGALAGIDDQSSSNDDQLTITDTAVVINEDSDDVDFRVESNGNANMLVVNAGGDRVGIGSDPDLGAGLHIKTSDTGASAAGGGDELVLENGSANCGLSILTATDGVARIFFSDSGDSGAGGLDYFHDGDYFRIYTNGAERLRIDPNFKYNKTDVAVGTAGFHIQQSGSDANGGAITAASTTPWQVNRLSNDGQLIALRQDSTEEGSISVSGSTVSYSTFCGTHWSRLTDNSKPTILRGTVIESVTTLCDWYQVEYTKVNVDADGKESSWVQKESISLPDGKNVGDNHTITVDGVEYTGKIIKEDNEQLPKCKISDTEESKAVYGVFLSWDDADDGLDGDVNDMNIAGLGAFVVRIHKDETVAIGDYLQSKGDGTAKKQADDILRASTIAKVTSTEKTHTYDDGSYCVPCTLHCG